MRKIILLLVLAGIAGCNRSPSVEAHNASIADVAAKVAAAGGSESFVRPGKWQTSIAIDSMEAAGLPPEAAVRMKSMSTRASAKVVESCLTPDEAKKPTPEMFSGNRANCRYDKFVMGGGKIDMIMRCSGGGPNGHFDQAMNMTGTYSPDAYHMTMVSKSDSGAPEMGPMTMKMHLDAKRLGDCPATAAAGAPPKG